MYTFKFTNHRLIFTPHNYMRYILCVFVTYLSHDNNAERDNRDEIHGDGYGTI